MRDADIRPVLRATLTQKYALDRSAVILEEFGVCCGLHRADMTLVNGELKGYEIKSDYDSLRRLRSQAIGYAKVFDTLTLVLGSKHLREARQTVPRFWGLMLAKRDRSGQIVLADVRRERTNNQIDPNALAQLLWRPEALGLLRRHRLHAGLHNKSRRILCQVIASNFALQELRALVREQLKGRMSWRVGDLRTQCDEMSQSSAKSSGYRTGPGGPHNRRYSYRPS